eukprot:Lankesteria_metandrocarpae@DN4818_c0_g1_i3.p1
MQVLGIVCIVYRGTVYVVAARRVFELSYVDFCLCAAPLCACCGDVFCSVALSGGTMINGCVILCSWPTNSNWNADLTVLDYYDSCAHSNSTTGTKIPRPTSTSYSDILNAITIKTSCDTFPCTVDSSSNGSRKMPYFKAHSEGSSWAVRRFFSSFLKSFQYLAPYIH